MDIVSYADDSTLSSFSKDPIVLKAKIDDQYQRISKYMAMNKLKLNSDKTHLMIMRTAPVIKYKSILLKQRPLSQQNTLGLPISRY